MNCLFLDDIRIPANVYNYTYEEMFLKQEWHIVRSYEEFVEWVTINGMPDFISFDHDLGDNEEWISIEEFPDYIVSNKGNIARITGSKGTSGGQLKLQFNKRTGGLYANLWKNNIHYLKAVHRLVAEAFIPNPENKPEVNHKDGNRAHNHEANLEWVTRSENAKHSHDFLERNYSAYGGNHGSSKSVSQYTLDGKLVAVWGGTNEASRQLGINQSNIVNCATGKYSVGSGFIWKYEGLEPTVTESIKKLPKKLYEQALPVTEKTGYDCAKWLVEYCLDNDLKLPPYFVHSQNPVGKDNINKLLSNFNKS